jgi:hypothetical protein
VDENVLPRRDVVAVRHCGSRFAGELEGRVELADARKRPRPIALPDRGVAAELTRVLELHDERLVETEEGEPLPAPPPLSDGPEYGRPSLRVSDSGERVLGGEADRVELLGVDRWLGGTLVTPKTRRWDPNARLVYAVS